MLEIQFLYKNNVTSIMKALSECHHVYEIIPQIQSNTCTKGKQWVNMIELYLLLIVFVAMIGFSFQRFADYIQKKIDERKDMEQNILFQWGKPILKILNGLIFDNICLSFTEYFIFKLFLSNKSKSKYKLDFNVFIFYCNSKFILGI